MRLPHRRRAREDIGTMVLGVEPFLCADDDDPPVGVPYSDFTDDVCTARSKSDLRAEPVANLAWEERDKTLY